MDGKGGIGMHNNLSFIVLALLLLNIIYIFYMFLVYKAYYNNFFFALCIYFIGLIEGPATESIRFSLKYGFSVVELMYALMVIIFILGIIISNNSTVIYNCTWKDFYTSAKEIFRRNKIGIYYLDPSVYLEERDSRLRLVYKIMYSSMIFVKLHKMEQVEEINDFSDEIKKELIEKKALSQRSRYSYFLINLFITVILILNIIY